MSSWIEHVNNIPAMQFFDMLTVDNYEKATSYGNMSHQAVKFKTQKHCFYLLL